MPEIELPASAEEFEALDYRELAELTGADLPPEFVETSIEFDFQLTSTTPEMDSAVEAIADQIREACQLSPTRTENLKFPLRLILANLLDARINSDNFHVAYSRRSNEYSGRYAPDVSFRNTMAAADGLIELGLIEHHIGVGAPPGREGYTSRMRATDQLIDQLRTGFRLEAEALTCRDWEPEIIILKNEQKEPIAYHDTPQTEAMREQLRRYNRLLRETEITLAEGTTQRHVDLSRKQVHRVFNDSSFDFGGRFNGPFWQHRIRRTERPGIIINGQPTVELDFQAQFVHLLYSEEGLSYHELHGKTDPYSVPAFDELPRAFRKTVWMRMLNTRSRNGCKLALTRPRKPLKPEELEGVDPRTVDLDGLLDAYAEKHQRIAHHFFTRCSLRLMRTDSKIAERVIEGGLHEGIPVLAVNDSFICDAARADWLRERMRFACKVERQSSIPLIN